MHKKLILVLCGLLFSCSNVIKNMNKNIDSNTSTYSNEYINNLFKEKKYRTIIKYLENKDKNNISKENLYYLADSFFNLKMYNNALNNFNFLLSNYKKNNKDVLYKLAVCYYKLSPKYYLDQKYTLYAIKYIHTYLDKYSYDTEGKILKKYLKNLNNKLILKDLEIGKNYLYIKDYKSAYNYFNKMYDKYNDSYLSEYFLLYLIKAEYKIYNTNKDGMKNDNIIGNIKIFKDRYPNSKYNKEINNIIKSLKIKL